VIIVKGFTLIELLVVIGITALLVGGGLAAYSRFNERQQVKGVGTGLYNDIRLIQGRALAQEKPEVCESGGEFEGPLERFSLTFSSIDSYAITAWCGGEEVDLGIQRQLPNGVTAVEGTQVHFFVLGRGSTSQEITVSGFGFGYQILIDNSGEVEEVGWL
jgi:prepilin-type N-terminal cleavage/methylation domain-containing protein